MLHLHQLIVQFRVVCTAQGQPGHAHDGVHRRAQFMAHVGQKTALGTAGGLGGVFCRRQFMRADGHQILQLVAMPREFQLGPFLRHQYQAVGEQNQAGDGRQECGGLNLADGRNGERSCLAAERHADPDDEGRNDEREAGHQDVLATAVHLVAILHQGPDNVGALHSHEQATGNDAHRQVVEKAVKRERRHWHRQPHQPARGDALLKAENTFGEQREADRQGRIGHDDRPSIADLPAQRKQQISEGVDDQGA